MKLLEVPLCVKGSDAITETKFVLAVNSVTVPSLAETYKTMNNILNQPFQPEMLEEYFGIKIKRDGFYNITKTKFIEFIGEFKDEFIGEYMDVYNTPRKNNWFKFPYPKTLAQFIQYCIDCGIELKWKGN